MSYDLALNRLDHDMVFRSIPIVSGEQQKHEIVLFDTADRVAQQIKINLLSFLGEWFLDVRYGVPYLESILVKNPRMTAIESILREHISSVPQVQGCQYLDLDWDRQRRALFVIFKASTDLGPIEDSFKLEMQRNV